MTLLPKNAKTAKHRITLLLLTFTMITAVATTLP